MTETAFFSEKQRHILPVYTITFESSMQAMLEWFGSQKTIRQDNGSEDVRAMNRVTSITQVHVLAQRGSHATKRVYIFSHKTLYSNHQSPRSRSKHNEL